MSGTEPSAAAMRAARQLLAGVAVSEAHIRAVARNIDRLRAADAESRP